MNNKTQREILKLISFFIFFICLWGCKEVKTFSPSTSDNKVNELNFSIAKEIYLPLDSISQPLNPYFQILEKDSDTLKYLFYNKFNESIYVYDFFRKKLIKKIPFTRSFGDSGQISAFHYINKDSIFYFPQYGDYFHLSREGGNMDEKKIKFVDEDDQEKIESHWIKSSSPLVMMDEKIYINNVFGWMALQEENDKFLLIEHDLKTGSSEFFLKHPTSSIGRNYENSTFRHMTFTQKGKEPVLLYSFNFDPYVYEFNGDKDNIKAQYCAPKDFQLPSIPKMGMDGNELWLEFQTQFSFSRMVYDPFKKQLLRLALLPYSMEAIKAGDINPEMPKKPKFYVFDEQNQLLGEFTLDKNKSYYFVNMFVTKEGLWIQRILEDDENNMCFELINYES